MAEITLSDEQMKSIIDEVKKQLLAESKSVQDFKRITALPASGSVTLPTIQPDGSCVTFDAGNWLKDRETAYEKTIEATSEASVQAEKASEAAALAKGVAANEGDREAAEKQRKAAEKQREAAFKTISDGNAAQLNEMKRLAESTQNSQSVAPMASVPASIFVEKERTANVGETVNVAPTQFAPSTCNHSVIYKVYDGNAKANYKGDVILPAEAGDVVIEVIPALNNGATRVVTIHAVEPTPILDLAGEQITDEKGEAITA